MSVEAVDSDNVNSEAFVEFETNNKPNWNGHHVNEKGIHSTLVGTESFFISLQNEVAQNRFFSKTFSSTSNIMCLKGSTGASASADTDGNKEVEAHVEISNEEGSASVEVSGSISQDSQGNTNASASVGLEWEF